MPTIDRTIDPLITSIHSIYQRTIVDQHRRHHHHHYLHTLFRRQVLLRAAV